MMRPSRWLSAALCLLSLAPLADLRAEDLVDLRASFARIEPYTKPPSPPVTKGFSIAGRGTLEITTVMAPWFRVSAPVRFRSLELIDGRDEGAWTEHVPGVESLGFQSTPERWVDGGNLTIVNKYRVTKPRPRLEVGLFPSVVRFGDGSLLQLANSVQLTVRWVPEGQTLTAAPTGSPAPEADVAGRWADADGVVTLSRNGNVVTGSYAYRDGRMTGSWAAPSLTGFWAQSQSNRRCDAERLGTLYWGRYELTLQGDRLFGRFGYCNDALTSTWSWTRVK